MLLSLLGSLLVILRLVVATTFLTQPSTKRPNDSISTLFSLVNYHGILARNVTQSYKIGKLSYASPSVWKLHPHSEVTPKTYKPTFHGSHLSRNTSYGSTATLWVFHLPWQGYSYLTQSSMMELLLSVS